MTLLRVLRVKKWNLLKSNRVNFNSDKDQKKRIKIVFARNFWKSLKSEAQFVSL